jgi:hypothetical protein
MVEFDWFGGEIAGHGRARCFQLNKTDLRMNPPAKARIDGVYFSRESRHIPIFIRSCVSLSRL